MMKLSVAIAFSSTNEESGIPSYLRQPVVQSFSGWDCEPRGVLGYIEGFVNALRHHAGNFTSSDLDNSSVRFIFDEIDPQDGEVYDTLALSMSLTEAPHLFRCWIENESSKCLMWATAEQVAEEFSRAKDLLGSYLLSKNVTQE